MPDGNLGAPAVIHVRKDGRIGILGKFSSHKGKMEAGRWHRVAVSVDLAKPEDSDDEDAADDDTSAIGQRFDLTNQRSLASVCLCRGVQARSRSLWTACWRTSCLRSTAPSWSRTDRYASASSSSSLQTTRYICHFPRSRRCPHRATAH